METVLRECIKHGLTRYYIRNSGGKRCNKCNTEAVAKRRKKIKQILVEEAGGCCIRCGYKKYIGALDFHHEGEKDFSLGERGLTRSIEKCRQEASKCILLCSNCHREIHHEEKGRKK